MNWIVAQLLVKKELFYDEKVFTLLKLQTGVASCNEGALSALHKVRGRKKRHDAKDLKINELEKSVGVLKARLLQAEAIIDVQKKVSEIFGSSTQSNICNGSSL